MPRLREVPLRDDGGPGSPRGVRGISFLRRVFPYELMLVLTLVAVAVVALRSEAAPLRRLLTSPMRAVMQRSSRQYSSGASGSGGLSALVERLENSMSLTRNDLDGADEYTGGTSASDERNTKQELLKKRLDRLSELLAAAVTEDSVDNTGGSATRPGQPRQAALGGAAAEVVARLRARLELQQQQRAQQATSGSAGQQAQQHPLSALTCPPAAACPACTEAASSPAACPRCPESPPAAACEDEYLDDATDSEQGFPFESAIVSGGDEGGPAGQSSAKRQGRRRRRRRRGSPTTPELLGLKNSNSGPAPGTSPGSGGAADDGYEEEDDLAASERLELLEEATARSPCPSAAPPPRVVVVVSVAPAPSCDSTRAIVLARECPACSTCPAVEEPRACSAAPECPTRSARPSPKSCPPAHPKEILPFPPMARGKVVFLSYGDDNFKRSLDRITDEARSFGVFDKVLAYTPSHFSKAYAEKNAELLAMPRGGGYWAWKSYFIWKTMQSLDYGDVSAEPPGYHAPSAPGTHGMV